MPGNALEDRAAREPFGAPSAAACEICTGTGATVLRETTEQRFGMPGRWRLVRCRACRTVRTDPPTSDPAAFYPTRGYYSYQPPSASAGISRERFLAAYDRTDPDTGWFVRRLARLGVGRLAPGMPPGPPGAVLDVGCGSGTFLLGLQAAGWEPHGVELDAGAAAMARAAGLADVRAGTLHEARLPGNRFDAVRFWHCLEHVSAPRAHLREARRLLRPGGTLTVGVPNFGSLLSSLARDRWFYLDVPRHLWHFEPPTLRALAVAAGFEDVQVRSLSTAVPLLGTIDRALGRSERLLDSRTAWYAALPAAALLDAIGRGDALELSARRP